MEKEKEEEEEEKAEDKAGRRLFSASAMCNDVWYWFRRSQSFSPGLQRDVDEGARVEGVARKAGNIDVAV